MRVVSLLPSATEILCHVGGAGLLVGRSHECDWPQGLQDLPVLTGARIAPPAHPGDSAAIDSRVREAREQGQSLYTLDTQMLERLEPDLILAQDLCDVCSIDPATVRAAANAIGRRTGRTPEVIQLNPQSVEQVWDDCLTVGAAVGLQRRAGEAVAALRERFYAAADAVPAFGPAPVVGFLEWTDPPFVAGHWNVQLIERAGGRHPLNETVAQGDAGAAEGAMHSQRRAGPSIAVPAEVLAAVAPEHLVIAPCGLTLDQTRAVAAELAAKPWFAGLPAARAGRVALVDGNQMFNRPGPRLVDAFQWLVAWLHDRPHDIPAGFPWQPMAL